MTETPYKRTCVREPKFGIVKCLPIQTEPRLRVLRSLAGSPVLKVPLDLSEEHMCASSSLTYL